MPFTDRPHELDLIEPLVGVSMLELGNKRNGTRTYKAYFESRGMRHVSVDWNGEDGALPLNLCRPLGLGTFDMVTNIGTTEHVADQAAVWRNIAEAMHAGSVLASITPRPGHWPGHGAWYPTAGFYEAFARQNGLFIERFYEHGEAPRRCYMARLARLESVPFVMPPAQLLHAA